MVSSAHPASGSCAAFENLHEIATRLCNIDHLTSPFFGIVSACPRLDLWFFRCCCLLYGFTSIQFIPKRELVFLQA